MMCIYKISSVLAYLSMRASKGLKAPVDLTLLGEVFFISVSCAQAEYNRLKQVIERLGGKVEAFFSKDITTLLVDDHHIEIEKPEYQPYTPLCAEEISRGKTVCLSDKRPELRKIPASSRGYSALSRSSGIRQNFFNDNYSQRLIKKARLWRITIVGAKNFILWTESIPSSVTRPRKKKQNHDKDQITKINGYFIKVEDVSQVYKPFYKMLPNDSKLFMQFTPTDMVLTRRPGVDLGRELITEQVKKSGITFWKNNRSLKMENMPNRAITLDNLKMQGSNTRVKCELQISNHAKAKTRKKENNYCECCLINFNNLTQHINGEKHQDFVSDEKNFDCVANLIGQFPTPQEFLKKYQQKCSNQPNLKSYTTSDSSFLEIPSMDYFEKNESGKINDCPVYVKDVISPIKTTDFLNIKNSNEVPVSFQVPELDLCVNINEFSNEESLNKFFPDVFHYKSNISNNGFSVKDFEDSWLDVFHGDEGTHSIPVNTTFLEIDVHERDNIKSNKDTFSVYSNSEIAKIGNTTISEWCVLEDQSDKSNIFNLMNKNLCNVRQSRPHGFCKADAVAMQSAFKIDDSLNFSLNNNLQLMNLPSEDVKLDPNCFGCSNDSICGVSGICLEKPTADCSFLPVRTDRMFSSSNSSDENFDKCWLDNVFNYIDEGTNIVEKKEVFKTCSSENHSSCSHKNFSSSSLSSTEDFPPDIPRLEGKPIWSVQKVTSDCLRLRFTRIDPATGTTSVVFSDL